MRIFWISIFLLAIGGSLYLSYASWYRYENYPTINVIDKDYMKWNTSLAAIFICPQKKLDQQKLESFLLGYPENERKNVKKLLTMLATIEYSNLHLLSDNIPNVIESRKFMAILYDLHLELKFQHPERSEIVVTEMGICYAFNSEVSAYLTPKSFFSKIKEKPTKTVNLIVGNPLGDGLESQILNINNDYVIVQFTEGVPVCDIHGLQCLGNHTEQLLKLVNPKTREKVACDCLPTCEDFMFYEEITDAQQYTKNQLFNTTNLKWTLSKFPRFRIRRDLIFDFSDLLVSIGGIAGLFLGCSVLSFLEIFYFITIRLFFYLRGRKD